MPGTSSRDALSSLADWAASHAAGLNVRQLEQLDAYLDNLLVWNRRLALVSQQDPASIVNKHFADAIVAANHCRAAGSIVDLGSGAGFPGLIIAVVCPATRVTLIEAKQKKSSFLLDTIRRTGLGNVEVLAERIETASRQRAGSYEVSIARALGSIELFLEYSHALLRETGRAISMKGPSFENEIETPAIERLGFRGPAVYLYSLPDGSERALLSFERL